MSIASSTGTGELTLAFSLSAIKRLEDPETALDDAQTWSQHVGVIDNDIDAVTRIVEEQSLQQDFDLGDRDKWLAMEGIRAVASTSRHVYVGTSAEDRRVATQLGWEFVTATEAAEKAEWTLSKADPDGGVLARLRRVVPAGLWPHRSH